MGAILITIACAAVVSISTSSCDTTPTTPSAARPGSGNKSPEVLDGNCAGTVAITNCGVGGAQVEYDEVGHLQATGMTDPDESGINARFARPVNIWNAKIHVGFPDNGALSYTAEDDQGNIQARLDIAQQSGQYRFRPTFVSPPNGGKSSYDVQIFDKNGNVVARVNAIDPAESILAVPECDIQADPIEEAGWSAYQPTTQGIWTVVMNTSCMIQWRLPDGKTVKGNAISVRERNERGFYTYSSTSNIFTSGNLSRYTVQIASAISFK